MGFGALVAPQSDNPNGIMGLHLVVSIKPTQYIWNLAFDWDPQPKHSIMDYMLGTTTQFQNLIMEALDPIVIFSNPMAIPTVPCEYQFYHPPGDRLQPPA
jgi:hypothetical protein